MDSRSTGLILRTRLLTETSLIVHWLTRDLGRIATVAKGARRQKSPFRGKLDLFYLADFSFARSSKSDLHSLREVALIETHPALRRNLDLLQQAAYGAALIEQTTEIETPVPEVHDLMLALLRHLSTQPLGTETVYAFELKLLDQLGLKPDLDAASLSPGARRIAEQMLHIEWSALARLKPGANQSTELRRFLHGFLIYHLSKIPKGRRAALLAGD